MYVCWFPSTSIQLLQYMKPDIVYAHCTNKYVKKQPTIQCSDVIGPCLSRCRELASAALAHAATPKQLFDNVDFKTTVKVETTT